MENRIEIDVTGLTAEEIEEVKRLVESKRQDKTNSSKASTNDHREKEPPFPCSPLGKRLEKIRRQIEDSDMPMLSDEEFDAEVQSRRGERYP